MGGWGEHANLNKGFDLRLRATGQETELLRYTRQCLDPTGIPFRSHWCIERSQVKTAEPKRIGLIAGSDSLPLVFAEEARKCGTEVVAVAIEGFTSIDIDSKARTYWIKPGELGKITDIFLAEKIGRVAMQGKVPQSIIFSNLKFDRKAKLILDRVKNRQTQSLLKAVADELAAHGIGLMDARTYLEPVLAVKGVLTQCEPKENEWADIEFGANVLRVIGSLDIGQSVVVKGQAILAIEAIEGTDAAIQRGTILGKGKAVVVKMAKPGQDLRFDLPVIGEKTVATMSECGADVLAIESGKTVILEKLEVVKKADASNVCIVAI